MKISVSSFVHIPHATDPEAWQAVAVTAVCEISRNPYFGVRFPDDPTPPDDEPLCFGRLYLVDEAGADLAASAQDFDLDEIYPALAARFWEEIEAAEESRAEEAFETRRLRA